LLRVPTHPLHGFCAYFLRRFNEAASTYDSHTRLSKHGPSRSQSPATSRSVPWLQARTMQPESERVPRLARGRTSGICSVSSNSRGQRLFPMLVSGPITRLLNRTVCDPGGGMTGWDLDIFRREQNETATVEWRTWQARPAVRSDPFT
jgi:hypothetical protein